VGVAQATSRYNASLADVCPMDFARLAELAATSNCFEAFADYRAAEMCVSDRLVFFPVESEPQDLFDAPPISLWYEESPLKRQLYRLPRKLLPVLYPGPNHPEFAAARLRKRLR